MRPISEPRFLRPFRVGHELNSVEQWKLERHPLDVYRSVIEEYARDGVGAIEAVPGEAERLKWVGLYPQRQGGDAFMLRIKLPGGRLRSAQAAAIASVVAELARPSAPGSPFGDRYVDITTRQDLQLHGLRIEEIPDVWSRLDAVGITTLQACGDSARNVTCCPVSGIDGDEVVEAYPIARALSRFFTGNRAYANLPRKFKLSVTGCLEDCAQAELNDVGLVPATALDGALGFALLVGGGLSDGPRLASDIDVFLEPHEVVEAARAVAQLFGELGDRENRGLSRMRYLVQELGPEAFRAELAERASMELRPVGRQLTRRFRGTHLGVHRQVQPGLSYVGISVSVGRLQAHELAEAADLAAALGDGTLRLTNDQNLVISGVADESLPTLLEAPLLGRRAPEPGPFEAGVVACTGSEYCRFAIVETKARAARWAAELDAALGGEIAGRGPRPLRIHVSGCSASCAQPQIADIGLRGETAHVGGEIVEAFDVAVGGALGPGGGFADWVAGAQPSADVTAGIVRLARAWMAEAPREEAFDRWARRQGTERLAALVNG